MKANRMDSHYDEIVGCDALRLVYYVSQFTVETYYFADMQ